MKQLTLKSESEVPELQVVYAEVYAPGRPDAQGEYMSKESIQKACHEFAKSGRMRQIDIQHDNTLVEGACVVESFVAREDDPVFIPGSWVVGMYLPDEVWAKVKKGELNGFSMEAYVVKEEKEVTLEIPPVVRGLTSKSEDHTHTFFVTYDDEGKFRGGETDVVNGHSHRILAGTHTEEEGGHHHLFSSVDNIRVVE